MEATDKLRLICNLKSCWIISIMGRLPSLGVNEIRPAQDQLVVWINDTR